MSGDTLYYLVREGTNIRALTLDGEPVTCSPDATDMGALLDFYEPRVKPECGRMVAMSIDDYYEQFYWAERRAKARVSALVQQEHADQEEF